MLFVNEGRQKLISTFNPRKFEQILDWGFKL